MSPIDRLALPRRQRVFEQQLLPAGDTLPCWTTLSLDCKLPTVPSPRGAYTLTTSLLGMPKYRSKQRIDFDLSDPLGKTMRLEYNSLQDPCLKKHFDHPRNRKQLVHNGLMTRSGKVVCDLKEFNNYREYLHHHNVTLLHMRKRKDEKRIKLAKRKETLLMRKEQTENGYPLESKYSSLSLVEKIRRREAFLSNQLSEKRKLEEEKHALRVRAAWEERKRRQEEALKKEVELGSRKPQLEKNLARHWQFHINQMKAEK